MKFRNFVLAVSLFLLSGVLAIPPLALSGRSLFFDVLMHYNGEILQASLMISPDAEGGLANYWKFWCLRLEDCEWGGSSSDFLFSVASEKFGIIR